MNQKQQKFALAALAIVVFGVLAVAEVIDGNAAMLGIAGVLAGMGITDGVNRGSGSGGFIFGKQK